MRRLTVLYDARCSLCRRARLWLERQRQIVPLAFVAAGSQEAWQRFPGLDLARTLEELTVVGDGGEVYRGAKAWLICLWALRRYRGVARRLATPQALPGARRAFEWISRHRPVRGAQQGA
jgi:predicted DCC family thiol-disulfide oxidoreductase YuxK